MDLQVRQLEIARLDVDRPIADTGPDMSVVVGIGDCCTAPGRSWRWLFPAVSVRNGDRRHARRMQTAHRTANRVWLSTSAAHSRGITASRAKSNFDAGIHQYPGLW